MSEPTGAGRAILDVLARLEAKIDALTAARPATDPTPAVDLDGEWGNPEVKKNPPRWHGDSHAGLRYSDCSPEFLDEMASFHDWRVTKAEDDKKRGYARLDAARARGWAARLRAGYKAPEEPAVDDEPPPF